MKWRRLTLRVDASDAQAASALLAAAVNACTSIEERAPDDDETVHVNGGRSRALVSAYVPEGRAAGAARALRGALTRARSLGLLASARRSASTIRDEDWATAWKRYYRPSKLADGLYVVPSWHKHFYPPRGGEVIQLDPGMAFGTGQHPTTKMAVQLALPHVRRGAPMLDVGCGSGILGLATARRGARVFACDVDPLAIAATRRNFSANGLRAAAIKRAAGVPHAFPQAPLIVSNITADVLISLAEAFARKLTSGGIVVTSGVTKRGRAGLLSAFKAAGLQLNYERTSGEWLAHVHVKEN